MNDWRLNAAEWRWKSIEQVRRGKQIAKEQESENFRLLLRNMQYATFKLPDEYVVKSEGPVDSRGNYLKPMALEPVRSLTEEWYNGARDRMRGMPLDIEVVLREAARIMFELEQQVNRLTMRLEDLEQRERSLEQEVIGRVQNYYASIYGSEPINNQRLNAVKRKFRLE